MAVPKRKTTPSRAGMRRSHQGAKKTNVVEDKTVGTLHRPHHVTEDGYYKGRQVTTSKVRP